MSTYSLVVWYAEDCLGTSDGDAVLLGHGTAGGGEGRRDVEPVKVNLEEAHPALLPILGHDLLQRLNAKNTDETKSLGERSERMYLIKLILGVDVDALLAFVLSASKNIWQKVIRPRLDVVVERVLVGYGPTEGKLLVSITV